MSEITGAVLRSSLSESDYDLADGAELEEPSEPEFTHLPSGAFPLLSVQTSSSSFLSVLGLNLDTDKDGGIVFCLQNVTAQCFLMFPDTFGRVDDCRERNSRRYGLCVSLQWIYTHHSGWTTAPSTGDS